MKALLLETSTEKALIALLEDGKPPIERWLDGGPSLSKNLALEVAALLDGQKVDLIAVGQGPGSYTGIRVGAALAQGLALGWGVPLVGFCSLEAFLPSSEYAVLIDARSGGLYCLYKGVCKKIPIDDPLLLTLLLLASPHPDLIRKRIALPGQWTEEKPRSRNLLSKTTPLHLSY